MRGERAFRIPLRALVQPDRGEAEGDEGEEADGQENGKGQPPSNSPTEHSRQPFSASFSSSANCERKRRAPAIHGPCVSLFLGLLRENLSAAVHAGLEIDMMGAP